MSGASISFIIVLHLTLCFPSPTMTSIALSSTPSLVSATSSPISSTLSLVSATSSPISSTPSLVSATSSPISSTPSLVSATSSHISSTPSLVSATSSPISSTTSLVSATASHISRTPSLVSATSSPISSTPSLVSATSSPISSTTSIVSATASHISRTPSLVSATSSHISSTPSLVSATSSPISSTPSLVSATSSPISSTPSLVSATSSPISSTPSLVSATSSPISSTPSLVSATSSPISSTPSLVSATSSPISSTPSLVSATSSPISSTPSLVSATASLSTPSAVSSPGSTTKSTSTLSTSSVKRTTTSAPVDKTGQTTKAVAVSISFTIKFNDNFTEALNNKSSTAFRNKSATYKKNLVGAFNKTNGFESITILRFWKGSIGVDYKVQYNHTAAQNSSSFAADMKTVQQDLVNIENVDATYVNDTFHAEIVVAQRLLATVKENPCSIEGVCERFDLCSLAKISGSIICTGPCFNFDCNDGQCYVDSSNGKAMCSCPPDDNYVYGGDKCEQTAEKLDMSSKKIIAIAAGTGGGLVFVLSVALAVTCFRRRKRSGKEELSNEDDRSVVSFQSLAGYNGQATGATPPANRLYRQQSGEAPTFLRQNSGLPMEMQDRPEGRWSGVRTQGEVPPSRPGQMRYGEDGRVYRVVKDSQIYRGPQESHAYHNQAFDGRSEDPVQRDRGLSQSGFSLSSQPVGRREHVYNAIDDDGTLMYQPSDKLPETRHSNISHLNPLNPLASVDPAELSGFPRHGDDRRPGEASRGYGDERSFRRESVSRFSESSRQEDAGRGPVSAYPGWEDSQPPREGAYQGREEVYPSANGQLALRDRRDSARDRHDHEDPAYSRVSKGPIRPAPREVGGWNPLVHDYSERRLGARDRHDYEDSAYTRVSKGPIRPAPRELGGRNPLVHDYSERRQDRRSGGARQERGHVYDYIPKEKMSIKRPAFTGRPAF